MWFLLLYASELLEKLTGEEREHLAGGERDNDLLDALAEVLAADVNTRARSMLTRGYRRRHDVLTRVRGKIDHLGTARGRLMESGRILCAFEEQSVDLPRYRFAWATLRRAAASASSQHVKRKCLAAARLLERCGVSAIEPTATALSTEQFGSHESADRRLVELSHLVRAMCAPEAADGIHSLPRIIRDEQVLRKLFERAVLGFYRFQLSGSGYTVGAERRSWPAAGTADDLALLPGLNADAVLRDQSRQVVVECKFAPIFKLVREKPKVDPAYLRQVVAYAAVFDREFAGTTEITLLGALVNDSPGRSFDLEIFGFPMRVRELDLTKPPSELRGTLMEAVGLSVGR